MQVETCSRASWRIGRAATRASERMKERGTGTASAGEEARPSSRTIPGSIAAFYRVPRATFGKEKRATRAICCSSTLSKQKEAKTRSGAFGRVRLGRYARKQLKRATTRLLFIMCPARPLKQAVFAKKRLAGRRRRAIASLPGAASACAVEAGWRAARAYPRALRLAPGPSRASAARRAPGRSCPRSLG